MNHPIAPPLIQRRPAGKSHGALLKLLIIVMASLLVPTLASPEQASAASAPSVIEHSVRTATPAEAKAAAPVAAPSITPRPSNRFGYFDILLDDYETALVAKSYWGGAVVCSPVAASGAKLGWAAAAVIHTACVTFVTVCAAQAYLSQPRKRAAMTISLWGHGWCWKY